MGSSDFGDAARLVALREGDERAFTELVDELSSRMLKLAGVYVSNQATAEEAVQEAWIVVLKSLSRFEGRSTLATWIFGIVVNIARKRGVREARSRPFSSFEDTEDEPAMGARAFSDCR